VQAEINNGFLDAGQQALMQDRIAQAHNAIYDYIHGVQPGAMVTSNVAFMDGNDPVINGPMMSRLGGKLDYVGLDYYYGSSVESVLFPGNSDMWMKPLQPDGIYYALQHYASLFPNLPLYVVENGMPTRNGESRPDGYSRADNLRDTIYWIQRAKADGVNMMGYNYWSLTDNYEWGSYTPRFGLYTVDVLGDSGLSRRPTDAVGAYSAITRAGGVPGDYRPTRGPIVCSLVDALASCVDPVFIPR
jgi:beta-glucosidase